MIGVDAGHCVLITAYPFVEVHQVLVAAGNLESSKGWPEAAD
jgi:hypothetical protein